MPTRPLGMGIAHKGPGVFARSRRMNGGWPVSAYPRQSSRSAARAMSRKCAMSGSVWAKER
jgi:hypothetical protein